VGTVWAHRKRGWVLASAPRGRGGAHHPGQQLVNMGRMELAAWSSAAAAGWPARSAALASSLCSSSVPSSMMVMSAANSVSGGWVGGAGGKAGEAGGAGG
jgi:hypothetical protein